MAFNQANLDVVLALRDRASQGLGQFQNRLTAMSSQLKVGGAALTGFGVAGALVGKSFLDAARQQEQAERVLATAVNNSGASWDSVREKVLATTAALQNKTNFGDEEQIKALATLTAALGDVDLAMESLPALLDLATLRQQSLTSAVQTFAPVMAGAANTVAGTKLKFDETMDAAERLRIILDNVGGTAEANADSMVQLGNKIGDLKEQFGKALLPTVDKVAGALGDVLDKVHGLNPNVVKTVAIVSGLGTAFALAVGPMLLFLGFLPAIIAGLTTIGIQVAIATGGLSLLTLAFAGGTAAWVTDVGGARDKIARAVQFIIDRFVDMAIMISPLGIVGIAWRNNLFGFQEVMNTVVVSISEAVQSMVNFFIDRMNDMAGAYNAFAAVFNLPKLGEIPRFTSDLQGLVDMLEGKVLNAFNAAGEGARGLLDALAGGGVAAAGRPGGALDPLAIRAREGAAGADSVTAPTQAPLVKSYKAITQAATIATESASTHLAKVLDLVAGYQAAGLQVADLGVIMGRWVNEGLDPAAAGQLQLIEGAAILNDWLEKMADTTVEGTRKLAQMRQASLGFEEMVTVMMNLTRQTEAWSASLVNARNVMLSINQQTTNTQQMARNAAGGGGRGAGPGFFPEFSLSDLEELARMTGRSVESIRNQMAGSVVFGDDVPGGTAPDVYGRNRIVVNNSVFIDGRLVQEHLADAAENEEQVRGS